MAPKRKCIIKNCAVPRPGLTISKTLHKFPNAGAPRTAWLNFLNLNHWNKSRKSKIPKCAYLCSAHFRSCCFFEYGPFRSIRAGHVPSVAVDEKGILHSVQNCHNSADQMDTSDFSNYSDNHQMFPSPIPLESLNSKLRSAELLIESYSKLITEKTRIIRQQINQINYLKSKIEKKTKEKPRIVHRKTKSQHTQTEVLQPLAQGKFSGILETMIDRRAKRKNISYDQPFREFAVSLHYYSPKAYEYLRSVTSSVLPSSRTLSVWTSGIQTSPGFLPDSISYLKLRNAQSQKYYCLSLDEVSIRKQILFDGKEMKGYVDYGDFEIAKPSEQEAANALFVMCTEINGNEKTPLAYVLTNGCDTDLNASIIQQSLKQVFKCNGKALTVTFDGLPANFNSINRLGASTNILLQDYRPFIEHPAHPSSNVYFTPDPCHMLKLLRNALQSCERLIDINGEEVKWIYFERLANLQNAEGMRAANKLSTRHIHFSTQKMKVRLAVQVLSSSSAVALTFCEKMGFEGFDGGMPTANFAKIIDRLFDTLNSHVTGTGYKAPLGTWNKHIWKDFFQNTREYLLNLKRITVSKKTKKQRIKPLVQTKLGTCIKGFVMCIDSLSILMDEVVLPGKSKLKYFPTYKLSQDHVELFFSSLRQRFGNNNNPNTVQLEAALRSMLAVRIKPNLKANCTIQDSSSTSQVSPLEASKRKFNDKNSTADDDLPDLPEISTLSQFVNNVVSYIAGFVGRAVSKQIYCEPCVRALLHDDPEYTKIRADYMLINEKNNGGLFIPSDDLVKVCREAERVIRQEEQGKVRNIKASKIVRISLSRLLKTGVFADLRYTFTEDHTSTSTHVLDLISAIIAHYTKIRLHYIAKETTIALNPVSIRNQMNKVVLFQGQ